MQSLEMFLRTIPNRPTHSQVSWKPSFRCFCVIMSYFYCCCGVKFCAALLFSVTARKKKLKWKFLGAGATIWQKWHSLRPESVQNWPGSVAAVWTSGFVWTPAIGGESAAVNYGHSLQSTKAGVGGRDGGAGGGSALSHQRERLCTPSLALLQLRDKWEQPHFLTFSLFSSIFGHWLLLNSFVSRDAQDSRRSHCSGVCTCVDNRRQIFRSDLQRSLWKGHPESWHSWKFVLCTSSIPAR